MSMPPVTTPVTHPSPMPADATIYAIRHAEKPASGHGLSPAGKARAQAYVKYFQNLQDPQGKTIHWDYFFASEDSENSHRPLLTIKPLADALNQTVDDSYKNTAYPHLVSHLQQDAKYKSSNIVICWHHGEILKLAQAMGASCPTLPSSSNWPATWPGDVFGWLLKMYYKHDGTLHNQLTQAINEKLMPDDTADPVYGK